MKYFWKGFSEGANRAWFPLVYIEILYFVMSPWKAPLWVQCVLFGIGTFLGGIVEAAGRLRP